MKRVPKDRLFLFAFSGHGVERDRKGEDATAR